MTNGRVRRAAAKWFSRLVRPSLGHVRTDGGIVSFTFDDFPKSAFATGGRILEDHNARGTYYACMAFAGTTASSGRMFDTDDVREAHRRGHEIACHTYSHIDCSTVPTARLLADTDENAVAFASLLGAFAPVSFAYPYAQPALRAKVALIRRFTSCRGGRPGINVGTVDLGELRATEIKHPRLDLNAMHALIDRNVMAGGWLIFFTHDVAERPSPFGCTPANFEAVVARAAKRCRILPVGQAAALIRDA